MSRDSLRGKRRCLRHRWRDDKYGLEIPHMYVGSRNPMPFTCEKCGAHRQVHFKPATAHDDTLGDLLWGLTVALGFAVLWLVALHG